MRQETKKLLIESAIAYVLVYMIHRVLIEIGYRTFDYCITHTCGVTHNFGYQDILWLFFLALPWICMVALIVVWIDYWGKKPVKVEGEKE